MNDSCKIDGAHSKSPSHVTGGLSTYVVGFALSLLLTMLAYLIAVEHLMLGRILIGAIMGLALLQGLVQLIFFLHLGSESKPRWNLYALLFMLLVLVIVVVGSIWVMANLDYRMMPVM